MNVELVSSALPLFQLNHERTKGRHVSTIIYDLCLRRGIYKEQDQSEMDTTRMRLGQAWEHALIAQTRLEHPNRYIEIPEIELDGIYGHLDLYDTQLHAVDEIKCTWMSSRHDIDSDKLWKYLVQLQAYLMMIRSTTGNLKVVYPRGDYRDKMVDYRHWKLEFSKSEIVNNWRTLQTHADLMEREGHQWQA